MRTAVRQDGRSFLTSAHCCGTTMARLVAPPPLPAESVDPVGSPPCRPDERLGREMPLVRVQANSWKATESRHPSSIALLDAESSAKEENGPMAASAPARTAVWRRACWYVVLGLVANNKSCACVRRAARAYQEGLEEFKGKLEFILD